MRLIMHRRSDNVRDMCIFAMLGALMFCSKMLMEVLPNIHLIGMFIGTVTVVFGKRGLIPIYIFVFLSGVFMGFATWWLAYVYIWAVLWGMFMLVPKRISDRAAMIIYPTVCAIHGFAFGVLYAPCQALIYGFDLKQTMVWIGAGLYFDILHGISNFAVGFLIFPLSDLMKKLLRSR